MLSSVSDIVVKARWPSKSILISPSAFYCIHIVLRHDDSFCRALQWRQSCQWTRGRNHRAARYESRDVRGSVVEPQRPLAGLFFQGVRRRSAGSRPFRQAANDLHNFGAPGRCGSRFVKRSASPGGNAKHFLYFAHRQPRVHGDE